MRTFTRTEILNKIVVLPSGHSREGSASAAEAAEHKSKQGEEEGDVKSDAADDGHGYTYVFSFRSFPPPANLDSRVEGWEKIVFTELSVSADSIRGAVAVSRQLEAKARKPTKLVLSFTLDDWATSIGITYTTATRTTPPGGGVVPNNERRSSSSSSGSGETDWTLSSFSIPCGNGSRFAAIFASSWSNISESACEAKQLQVRARYHRSEIVRAIDVLACRVHVASASVSSPTANKPSNRSPSLEALELAEKEMQKWYAKHRSALRAKSRRSSSAGAEVVTPADILRWATSSPMLAGSFSTTLTLPKPLPHTTTTTTTTIPRPSRGAKWTRRRNIDDGSGSEDEDDFMSKTATKKAPMTAPSADFTSVIPASFL
ncbi:hypothetical protein HDU86_000336 [Geranomyces michiganensis]|nr:hypothetical protein HDU86_000336 [Geranomyces michiganensis]